MTNQTENITLPRFRRDLTLFKGPPAPDGTPTFTLYDPVKNQYYQFTWVEASIIRLSKPGMTLAELVAQINQTTTLKITDKEVLDFYHQASEQGLLEIHRESKSIAEEATRKKEGIVKIFLKNYLFFRIPLVNPDKFLKTTLPIAEFFLQPAALLIYLFCALWGLALITARWDQFIHTFTYFFNWEGLLVYGLGITFVKIIHELAHAYTAKKFGLHIPTMGVAFIVLFPVLYTDATDAWRIPDRKKRLAISSAGVFAELALAGFATVGWAFSNPGIFQSLCFVIASVNWINTLMINGNPALRYDGYYIMSDLLGIDNLQVRAHLFTRWAFYHYLLGANLPDPEEHLTKGVRKALVIYGFFTWCYRLFLYTAIALFIYFEFTKIIGTILFLVEIWLFFLMPAIEEFRYFWQVRSSISLNWRSLFWLSVLTAFIIWFVFPWPHQLSFYAITVPIENQVVYAPNEGHIKDLEAKRGKTVRKDEILLSIDSDHLNHQLHQLESERAIIEKKVQLIGHSDEMRSSFLQYQAQMMRLDAEIDSIRKQISQNKIVAQMDGYIYNWDELLRNGEYISKDQILGQISHQGTVEITGLVPESVIGDLHAGMPVSFSPIRSGKRFEGKIKEIVSSRADFLIHPQLASTHGGPIPVSQVGQRQMVLLESYYPIKIELMSPSSLPIGQIGKIYARGPWSSKLITCIEWLIDIFRGESQF